MMYTTTLVSILCGCLLWLAEASPVQGNGTSLLSLKARIWDEQHVSTAARIRFSNMQGKYFAPEGHEVDFPLTFSADQIPVEKDVMLADDRRFAYVVGELEIQLPDEMIRMEVVKGFRYKMIDDTIQVRDYPEGLDIYLQKAFDLPDENWYCGDVHVHHINPASALMEMKAEDLNVCNILISDFTKDHELYRGTIEPISDSRHLLFLGQEYRENLLGHVNLLNLKQELIQPARSMRTHQYPLNLAASDRVREQGGHISWAHFAAWPGLEGPLGVVLKKVDAVELLCTIDPFHEPIFVTDVVPELRMNSGLRLWYRLLNCGLHIPATAGTDKMGNLVTVGANRVYAKVDSAFDYDHWIDAINRGRSFVTNSPFLTFEVDGKDIGSTIDGSAGKTYQITAEVWSQFPLDRLEIIANGELLVESQIPKGTSHAKIEFTYRPEGSVWLAARAYRLTTRYTRQGLSLAQRRNLANPSTLFNRYFGTLRPEVPFAHTNPIFLLMDGQPIQSAADANYFVRYLDNVMSWLDSKGSFPSKDAKREVLETFEQGKQVFDDLAN